MAAAAGGLAVSGLSKSYGSFDAVRGVSFRVEPGSFCTLLGPSGSGKTSVLRMVAGLIEPTAGEVRLAERVVNDVSVHRRDIGLMFQQPTLFPHLSVAQNVGFGLAMRNWSRQDIHGRVAEMLALVDLTSKAERRPDQLSGGEQQRIALARALAPRPKMLLLDEPFTALDKELRQRLRREVRELHDLLQLTTVLVTHDQEEALELSDQIVVMRSGAVEQIGTPHEVYQRPISLFVAGFVGGINQMPGVKRGAEVAVGDRAVPSGRSQGPDGPGTLVVRPKAVRICDPGSADAAFVGRVQAVRFYGDHAAVDVAIDDVGLVTALVAPSATLSAGDLTGISWESADAWFFAKVASISEVT